MIKQQDLEKYLSLPLDEQRQICKGKLYETENNSQPDIESTIVELNIPIEEFMSRNGAVRLTDFEEKINNQKNGTE